MCMGMLSRSNWVWEDSYLGKIILCACSTHIFTWFLNGGPISHYIRKYVRAYVPEYVTLRNVDRNVSGFLPVT